MDTGALELVGHRVIETREGLTIVHHGLNKDYRPVGYTVDSFSQDLTVIGEYSAVKDYFENAAKRGETPVFEKIETDIQHALSMSPDGPGKIYLICSQEEPESFRAKFSQTEIAKAGREIIILDARELAKDIYKYSKENPSEASFYCDFFPDFAQNLDHYEYYGKAPAACQNHCSEPVFLNAIRQHYREGKKVCVIFGVSGTGKTQAAIDFLHQQEFSNYIWITGEDWKPDTPLSAIKRSRGGVPVNVAGTFNTSNTLLVIDNLERPFDESVLGELKAGFDIGGVVLATSQIGVPGNLLYLPIPELSNEVAFKILEEVEATATEVCKQFVRACKFSPLILATSRNIIAMQGVQSDDLYRDTMNIPGDIANTDGTPIMRKILARLDEPYKVALTKIADSEVSAHDSSFLNSFLGINAKTALQRLAILKPANISGMLVVHDLICKVMRDNQNNKIISFAIEKYIAEHSGNMIPSVLREIHACSYQLQNEHERRGKRKSVMIEPVK